MALNDKSGFSLEDRINRKKQIDPKSEYADTPTPTVTDTPKYAPAHFPTVNPEERKTARLQLSVKPSTKSKLAVYARAHGTSSNEVVQKLLDDLLGEVDY
jgi:hypothetical protein